MYCYIIFSDVDDVHDMMDDIAEQTEVANEISNAISQPVGFGDRWIYRAGDHSLGMDLEEFLEVCSRADLFLIRGCPITLWRSEYDWPGRRIFIDSDPGFTQFCLAKGDADLAYIRVLPAGRYDGEQSPADSFQR